MAMNIRATSTTPSYPAKQLTEHVGEKTPNPPLRKPRKSHRTHVWPGRPYG